MLFNTFMLVASTVGYAIGVSANSIRILHINDHHSNLDEQTLDLTGAFLPPGLTNVTSLRTFYGGASRISKLIQGLRSEANTTGKNLVTVHGGDAVTGTLFFSTYKGEADAAFMNRVGFDAMVLGNHEFDEGDEGLAKIAKILDTTLLSYNLRPAKESPLLRLRFVKQIKPYLIKSFPDGSRLAICAITTKSSTEQSSSPMVDTTFDEEVASATQCVAEVSELGVNRILLMTHVGYSTDLNSLAKIPGVDVIVGGHSHTLLADQAKLGGTPFTTSGPYATIVNKTCVVQAWDNNRGVGQLDVDFDANGEVVNCLGQIKFPFNGGKFTVTLPAPAADLKPADAQNVVTHLESFGSFKATDLDTGMDSALAPFRANLTILENSKIADVPVRMCHSRGNGAVDASCPGKELRTAVGGGVCHIVAQSFIYNIRQADVAIQNGGGCRVTIESGNFTIGNAFKVLPFANTLVILKMSGDQIKRVLEDAVNFAIGPPTGSGAYPFSAGLRWRLDYSKAKGSRFSNIEVNKRLNATWVPLNLTEIYTVVTTNFLATPRDGYTAFGEIDKNDPTKYTDTYFVYAQSLIDYAKFLGVLNDPPAHQYSTQYFVSATGVVSDLGPEVSRKPTKAPTKAPVVTKAPTKTPTKAPTKTPTKAPTKTPTKIPTKTPAKAPTKTPTKAPSTNPTPEPTQAPKKKPCVPESRCRSSAQCCGRRCNFFRRCT